MISGHAADPCYSQLCHSLWAESDSPHPRTHDIRGLELGRATNTDLSLLAKGPISIAKIIHYHGRADPDELVQDKRRMWEKQAQYDECAVAYDEGKD